MDFSAYTSAAAVKRDRPRSIRGNTKNAAKQAKGQALTDNTATAMTGRLRAKLVYFIDATGYDLILTGV